MLHIFEFLIEFLISWSSVLESYRFFRLSGVARKTPVRTEALRLRAACRTLLLEISESFGRLPDPLALATLAGSAALFRGSRDERQALLISIELSSAHSLALLLTRDPNFLSDVGTSPLGRAIDLGQPRLVRLLLRGRASPDGAPNEALTPLYRALWRGRVACLRLLLMAGATISRNALFFCVRHGTLECTRALLPYSRASDLEETLELAWHGGSEEVLLLLERVLLD